MRTLYDNAPLKEALAEAGLPVREFFTFTTERGDELNGYMLKPLDFDPAKRYPGAADPVFRSGVAAGCRRVGARLGGRARHAWLYRRVRRSRGTGYRGEEFKKLTYGNLGRLEVEDQISTARYMARQSYVDPARIGIYGWSYGGFMALGCAFRGEGLFKMAIAVAPGHFVALLRFDLYGKFQWSSRRLSEGIRRQFARQSRAPVPRRQHASADRSRYGGR